MKGLPGAAHPTAKAFFDALDRYNQERHEPGAGAGHEEAGGPGPSVSESLRRKTQQLGWRNRHSQNEHYPITVLQRTPTPGQTKTKNGGKDHRGGADRNQNRDKDGEPQSQPLHRLRSRSFSVRQVQRGEVEGTYGTGATVWPAALVLVKYLERVANDGGGDTDPCDVRGKHVLDLGAGTGVTSIAAALLGAASVVCTDGEESVVRLARDNVRAAGRELARSATGRDSGENVIENENDQSGESDAAEGSVPVIDGCPIRTQRYWWGEGTSPRLVGCLEDQDQDEPPGGEERSKSTDSDSDEDKVRTRASSNGLLLLVADCVLPKLYPIAPLVQAIDECLGLHENSRSGGEEAAPAAALLSYEHRYYPDYDPGTEFRRLAAERCLDVATVPRERMDPVYSLDDVELWVVRRRRQRPAP